MFSRLLNSYNNALTRRPILVTSLSTGFCYGSGDMLAQYIETRQGLRNQYDYHRLGVFTGFGTIMAGPVYYAWFSKINKMPALLENVVRWNQQRILTANFKKQLHEHIANKKIENFSMRQFREQFKHHFDTIDKPLIRSKTVLVSKVYADQFIFSVIYPVFFMISTGMLLDLTKRDREKTISESFNDSIENVKAKFAKIYMADLAIWPLVQMANFAFIPAPIQPIFVNIVNIGWNAFLSYVSQGKGHGH